MNNSFANFSYGTSSKCETFDSRSMSFKISFIILYSFIALCALVGNSCLVYIIYKNPRMKSSFNYFTANMAFSDIIFQFCSLPRLLTDLIVGRVRVWLIPGTLGVILCKMMYVVQDTCTAVSIECIVLIAVDRFLAVVTPTKMRLESHGKLRVFIAIMTWVVALLINAPYLHFQKVLFRDDGSLTCTIDWTPLPKGTHNHYMAVLSIMLFFIPLGIITTLYAIIFTIVKHRKIPGHVPSDRKQFRHYRKAKTNVLQLSLAVVSVFVISWAPYMVYVALLMTVWNWKVPCGTKTFRFVALLMVMSNTATNPWIYFLLSANYRQGLKRLLSRGKRCEIQGSRRTWVTKQTISGAEADIGGPHHLDSRLISTSL